MTPRGAFKTYRKIDVYLRGVRRGEVGRYLYSTNAARNLRIAREMRFQGFAASDLVAFYSEPSGRRRK